MVFPKQNPPGSVGARLLNPVKKIYDRLLKIHGTPKEIALGFALGLFVGMSPTMGFQMAIAIFLASLLGWNRISSALGVWITNPVTAPFIYGGTYYVGATLLGCTTFCAPPPGIADFSIHSLIARAPQIFWTLTFGGIVLGLPLALAGYFLSFSAVKRSQARIQEALQRRKQRKSQKKSKKSGKNRKQTRKKGTIL